MNIIVTGCAGFIGSHLCEALLAQGHRVVGIDCLDNYYEPAIKWRNLENLLPHAHFEFYQENLLNTSAEAFEGIDVVVHLAARAGVRPSIQAPALYIEQNIVATQRLLDLMKEKNIKHLVFGSSSSVYGNIKTYPYSESMDTSTPISPYGLTKKACEMLTYTYHSLYQLSVVNLRFFTVYGERQRPDLAICKFVDKIRKGEAIELYGKGDSERDYTYIADLLMGIQAAIQYSLEHPNSYEIINIGSHQPIRLDDLLGHIEASLGKKAIVKHLNMQEGDLFKTYADLDKAQKLLGYQPQTPIQVGIERFVRWSESMGKPIANDLKG
jgi:UDP-glucuronate 4-epimerase